MLDSNVGSLLNVNVRGLVQEYLDNHLPKLNPNDWWKKNVIWNLSNQQSRYIEEKQIDGLSGLDLAALLRVLRKNSFDISWHVDLPPSFGKTIAKVSEVRNRWAHATAESPNAKEAISDVKVLIEFCEALGSASSSIEALETEFDRLTKGGDGQSDSIQPIEVGAGSQAKVDESSTPVSTRELEVGDIVALAATPTKQGAIVRITPSDPENRYEVFIDGAIAQFYESQLTPIDDKSHDSKIVNQSEFLARMSAIQLLSPVQDNLYSLNSARVEFVPYQFRPVLKFIRADRPRLLIADSVGVGKTIEAGLILKELQARQEIESVLVVCPRPLVTERKWQNEMKRFGEEFVHLSSAELRYCIDETQLEGEWPDRYKKAILPYSILDETMLAGGRIGGRNVVGITEVDFPPQFDLIIVDEAHQIRNIDTLRHQAVRFFVNNANAAVFLTATPIQLGSEDLFVLLNTLRPDYVVDRSVFEQMSEPNGHINAAIECVRQGGSKWSSDAIGELQSARATGWGQRVLSKDPVYAQLVEDLDQVDQTKFNEADSRLKVVRKLEELHTFSGILNRTRRRDIGDFTVRDPKTITIEFTDSQRHLHDALLQCQASILEYLRPGTPISFMMSTLRRQASSCLYGLAPSIDAIIARRLGELVEETDQYDPDDDGFLGQLPDQVKDNIAVVRDAAATLEPEDPKLFALKRIIIEKRATPNPRVMVFSSFRHTLRYLEARLLEDSLRVGVIHGGVADEDRRALSERFRAPSDHAEAIDVLLFSEVGSEGLDYQHCDCMVNYDLPWNPMRIEQRIGRIDRRGQLSEKVLIYNLITPETIDAEIYERCLLRIGVFNRELGSSEEILGEIARDIQEIAEDFALTESQRREKLQQLADNQVRAIQEREALEEQQAEILGIDLPRERLMEDLESATSSYLTPAATCNLVERYLASIPEVSGTPLQGEGGVKTLRLNQEARERLLSGLRDLGKRQLSSSKSWAEWLRGTYPTLSVTFEAERANEHPEVELLNVQHPLVVQAAKGLDYVLPMYCEFDSFDDTNLAHGAYDFALYEWSYVGLRDETRIVPVCLNQSVEPELGRLLATARDSSVQQVRPGESDARLETEHYARWDAEKAKHIEAVRRKVDISKQSVTASHEALVADLSARFERATEDRIRRMRKAQIANAEINHQRRLRELESALKKADIHTRLLVVGALYVQGQ